MSHVRDLDFRARRAGERGGSRVNLLIVMVILVAAAYAGYQFIPVAYQASQLKLFMQDTVNNAVITDKNAQWTEDQLRKNLSLYGVPPNALVNASVVNARMEAHVQYSISIPLIVTTYDYKFDYTARSNNLLSSG
ncbi:MAG TPA: hypothetical protein VJT82_03745 [Pyrinomonadaceae bacterium]|nr:hypothetical protein [Pyrinomonadaceae bacterium]